MEKLLIIPAALILAAFLLFEPKIDRNLQTGKLILWFNWNHERKHIEL